MTDDAWLAELLHDRGGLLADAGVAQEVAATLAARRVPPDPGGLVTRMLLEALDEVWERGWQPADLAHAARKDATAASVPLVVALIAEHARRSGAARRAPQAWLDQLQDLDALAHGDAEVVATWTRTGRRPPIESWRIVLLLAGLLRTAARLEVLVPPPSRWGAARPAPSGTAAQAEDDRALRRIRGLLAKAESSEFAEEAETLTAKAQELMTRYAVDAALLSPGRPAGAAVGTRRVHVAEPYVRAKMQLLAAVSEANDVRLVWYQGLGIANLVGGGADLDAVELLFTSLLLQVAQGLAGAEGAVVGRPASRAFRRAFLLGYAHRIGERLQAARQRATADVVAERGPDLRPVLRSRREAVEKAVAELFPKVRSGRSRSSVDAGGWYAGRSAAERADVAPRRTHLG
ncbi:DUF2786 domain-containing protein [Blastococcus litoris]|uniref:DUF2786 domain-containing protein n=1 Tax=Blastococcus litoris TaxID=2171622 RepID=UPI0013DF0D31|nr:DUF2786 domain-containing protein [Blastococcus litoris]